MLNIPANHVFAGINTIHGYVPNLKELIKDAEEVYIIKGTPGSGKSTLMKRLLSRAEEKGEKSMVIHCSSDPDSLDGVYFIDRKTAVVDGTPPHIVDVEIPVLRDHLVDIMQYCDRDTLLLSAQRLKELQNAKKESCAKAYSSLYALGVIEKASSDAAEECFDDEKIRRAASLFAKKRVFGNGKSVVLPMECVCGKGIVRSGPEGIVSTFTVCDRYGTSAIFMKHLCRCLEGRNVSFAVIPSPVDDRTPDAVFLPDEGLFVVTDRYEKTQSERRIDMLRFAEKDKLKEMKSKLGLYAKLSSSLLDDAVCEMKKASGFHSDMEKIYSSAFDFSRLDAVYEGLRAKVFKE